ncbi:leucine-rich repeat protein [Ruminococcus albus]|uniref:Leucine rich repeat-containing protein n=1 Tax=Ruminococcus albus TaxID=1264 RepID=A0A1H7JFY8_RUMAL|nr:Leucine rich repeat-containing protein [Ruminococcus albus]
MNNKKIVAGLLALTFAFGGAALPNTVVNSNAVISASAAEKEVLTYGDFKYTLLEDGTAEIRSYEGKNTKVEIPAEVDGVAVTSIGYAAFHYNTSIVSVSMPDSITTMDREVFAHCSNLVEVKLSANLTDIGSSSFVYRNPSLVIKCYNGSKAEKYALANGINIKVIDAKDKTEYPVLNATQTNSVYRQIRLNWTAVEGAEQYGVAVYLAGKWRIQTQSIPANVTSYTTPKNLRPATTNKVVIVAKVNGKWDTRNLEDRSFSIYTYFYKTTGTLNNK